MLVGDLLSHSPLRLVTVERDTYIREAAQKMARYGIGLVVVVRNADEVVGVLSERDIIAALGSSDTIVDYALVGDLMSDSVVTISPQDSLVDAVLAMSTHSIRHLVAMENDKPVGVLSIRDVLRVFSRELLENEGDTNGRLTKELVEALAS